MKAKKLKRETSIKQSLAGVTRSRSANESLNIFVISYATLHFLQLCASLNPYITQHDFI